MYLKLHPNLNVELNLHMDITILTSKRGLLNYQQISKADSASEKRLPYYGCRQKFSLISKGGIRGRECMYNSSLTLEWDAVSHAHIPKSTQQHCSRTETYDDIAKSRAVSPLEFRKCENPHEEFNEDILSMKDATAALKQEAGMFCIVTFTSMIKKSKEEKNLEYAKTLHLCVCAAGLDELETPGNHLVPMFVDCGSISYAQQAFNKISFLNEHSWTSLMQGYIACGKPDLALTVFQVMQEESSVAPSKYTYTNLLKACAKLKDLQKGQEIHDEVVSKGMEEDPFICNMLVDLYAKCCFYLESLEVFARLPSRDVVSWNVLIGGYVESGLSEKALECCDQMNRDGVPFDSITYACSFKACRDTGAINKGREVHADMAIQGFETDGFVCSALVDMYAKCDLLLEAQDVFDMLPYHDAVVWTALIAGYVEGGLAEDALICLEQMQLEGITPDAVSYIYFLKACGMIGALDSGQEIHSKIVKGGFENDPFVGNALLSVYITCGAHEAAMDVFGKLPGEDVVSWNALIAAYTEQGHAKEALNCWERLKDARVSPDEVTVISSLKACGLIKALRIGREIHVNIAEEEFESYYTVGIVLVDMYAKCGLVVDAQEVFNELPFHSVISWTALISGYADNGLGAEALRCFEKMREDGVLPNGVTFVCILKACGCVGAIEKGQDLHMEIIVKGLDKQLDIGNTLVDMYTNFGLVKEAQHVFDQQEVHDVVSWNALISGHVQCGLHEEANDCFEQMQLEGMSPNEVSWNALISSYAEEGAYEKSFKLYALMQEQGLLPNDVTFISIMKACGSAAALEAGRRVHAQIVHFDAVGDVMSTVLIDMYGKSGSMVEAKNVFATVSHRDGMAWNVLIANYSRQGNSEVAIAWFEMMREKGIKPDGFTVLSILMMCMHAGLVGKGQLFYEEMCKYNSILATTEHHNCLVGLFGRAGQLNEAMVILETLSAAPSFVSWSTVLGACQKWSDLELGTYAFEAVLATAETHSSAFVIMSNMYGD